MLSTTTKAIISLSLLAATINAAPTNSSGGGTCKPGFLNTVFNTGSARHASWPDPIWSTLTSYGIENFITFTLAPLSSNHNFDTAPGVPARYNPTLEAARIPIVMDPRDVRSAKALLQPSSSNNNNNAPSPPKYLELFNEPDLSYDNATPLTDPIPAAMSLSSLVNLPHPSTTFISPALASPNNASWLPVFFQNCLKCVDEIDILAMHLYDPNPDSAIAQIETFHNTWPDKKIWITEFGPYNGGGSGCTFDEGGVEGYAREVVPRIDKLGYVEKVFWNCGDAEKADVCNPSLTGEDGGATGVLKALGGACGFGGG